MLDSVRMIVSGSIVIFALFFIGLYLNDLLMVYSGIFLLDSISDSVDMVRTSNIDYLEVKFDFPSGFKFVIVGESNKLNLKIKGFTREIEVEKNLKCKIINFSVSKGSLMIIKEKGVTLSASSR